MNRSKAFIGVLLVCAVLFGITSCGDEVIVKPASKLRLEYELATYDTIDVDCPYSFQKNRLSRLVAKRGCGVNLEYPNMKATVYLTYQPVREGNLKKLLQDAQKLTYDHTVKANEIFEQPRVDSINKVFGMFYMINGDAATQSQFYVTDSLNHFVAGSLYFESKPNFDSIYPAVVYLRDDIRRIMETITWKN
ncbi:MAG: gliding motility lipoprotein GldD [Flavobacteriaceae bacterium]|nr:gliding motility lipoprotein GldD [Flavobacteriaceae bacterium]